jgi:hypothetical protein
VKAKPKGVAINKLDSGLKINLSRQPDASIATLQSQELNALFQALKLGAPKDDDRELHDQKAQAKALLDGFCDKFADLATDPRAIQGPNALVLTAPLSGETRQRLLEAAEIAHCKVHVSFTDTDDWTAPPTMRLEVLFGAMENARDATQALKTATGGRGLIYKAVDDIAAILADEIRNMDGHVEIGFVSGLSMGGGTAQAFLAGLESRVQLPASPPLILLDPQLLNDAQSRHATRHGTLGYDFEKPRGIAISLDYDKAPRRSLMGLMKGPGGYKYPGLLHLTLGLKDTDGPKGGKPMIVPPGLGYHGVGEQYEVAIRRFTRDLGESPPPSSPRSFRQPSRSGSEEPGTPGV